MRSDLEIVRAVKAGDRSAFALLVERYGRAVRATALDVVGDHHAAEDAEQEAFVAAYRKLATLRSGSHFGPWLMQIARRVSLNAIRRRRRTVPLDGSAELAAAPGDGELKSDLKPLLVAVMKLPEQERQAVMLRYFAGYSVKDVAAVMSRSLGSVTKQLWRARQRMRGWLEEK